MDLAHFQANIVATYGERDRVRGREAAVAWLAEEVVELARAVRKGTREQQAEEFAVVLAWLASLAGLAGIDLDAVTHARYGNGCPKCGTRPCTC